MCVRMLYFISLLVSKFIHCVDCLSNCFLHAPFQLHSPQFILARVLLAFKNNMTGKLELSPTINSIIISKPRGPYLPLPLG